MDDEQKKLVDEYWSCVTVKDSSWEAFCKHPNQPSWDYYVQCSFDEKTALTNCHAAGLYPDQEK